MTFGGATLTKADIPRLNSQLKAVLDILSDGQPRTLAVLAAEVSKRIKRPVSEAGISARLRDLRKEKFGGYTVDRLKVGPGLFSYVLLTKVVVDIKAKIARPIEFNLKGTPSEDKTGIAVAGSRSANSYLDSLQQ